MPSHFVLFVLPARVDANLHSFLEEAVVFSEVNYIELQLFMLLAIIEPKEEPQTVADGVGIVLQSE